MRIMKRCFLDPMCDGRSSRCKRGAVDEEWFVALGPNAKDVLDCGGNDTDDRRGGFHRMRRAKPAERQPWPAKGPFEAKVGNGRDLRIAIGVGPFEDAANKAIVAL
ncbi:hypothetical protein HNQ71_006533 [Mesorhizobium sangaii]|uniref:Uncharacterized protein n=1 Tax=Mesorhizobium sangaii TaxID=505389 RepID=A0A841PES7_9HYPH|nr:hypothetical protein [Mesorhizobium sangaii]MBB6413824.1 hypothetical protein [Mesorhizobium sangaii]